MNLQDQVIYRCIHAACARPLPRKVNFCPYCGTGQHDGVVNHAHVARPQQAEYREAPPVATPAPAPVVAKTAPAAIPAPAPAPAPVPEPEMATAPAVPAPSPVVAAAPAAAPTPPPPPVVVAAVVAPSAPAPPVEKTDPVVNPAPPAARVWVAAPTPKRQPVRLRHWLIVLAALWLIWLYARPSTRNIEDALATVASASEECRMNDAQSALIKLKLTKATPEQVNNAQKTVDTAANSCGKKQAREKAWTDTQSAVEQALADGEFSKAQARLSLFTKRHNEDGATRKLKEKIAIHRAAAAPAPLPYEPVEQSSGQTGQSVRNLIAEAERALQAGNYQAASAKLETCITMVDPGNRECAAFKVHADRMQADRQRCLAFGRDWYEDRCR